ncbi:hypothetical protein [Marispirochaeta sp.]|uniref:HD domain-containing protein n=1 Tax=Marispirochaeta sp. TaxID=2038653 RepID=UPI0029C7B4D9|nr:hypothetical protein [Marispirochaeta sp.]
MEKLEKNKIYTQLVSKCNYELNQESAHIITLINDVVDESCSLSKTIIKHMPEYTLHDETHLFRVLMIMERLIPESTLLLLSIPELMLLIITAFLHDIGMAPPEDKVKAWKRIWNESEPTEEELNEFSKFNRFRDTFPNKILEIEKLRNNDHFSQATLIEDYIISEYIRSTHEERAREYIALNWADKLLYKDKNLSYEVSKLCFSHGANALSLLELETNVLCDESNFICLPFIGVILRLADILDFDAKRTPSVLFSHLAVKNPVSLKEWQKHRAVQSWIIKPDKIAFHAKCSHPAIEKSIYDFCDQIDKELINCNNVLSRINDDFRDEMGFYRIPLPPKVDRSKILPEIDILTDKPIYIYGHL